MSSPRRWILLGVICIVSGSNGGAGIAPIIANCWGSVLVDNCHTFISKNHGINGEKLSQYKHQKKHTAGSSNMASSSIGPRSKSMSISISVAIAEVHQSRSRVQRQVVCVCRGCSSSGDLLWIDMVMVMPKDRILGI